MGVKGFAPTLTSRYKRHMLERLFSLLYPPICLGCQGTSQENEHFCAPCFSRIEVVTPPLCSLCGLPLAPRTGHDHPCGCCLTSPPIFRQARAWACYVASEEDTNPLTRALHLFKYTRVLSAGKALSRLAAAHFPLSPKDYDLILPVPLHLARLRWRGFNQALVLARAVGRRCGLPTDPFSLERIRATDPQVHLKEEERRMNVRGAFAATRPGKVREKRILLVDDVYTTGATVNECARTLHAAGARYVDVFTLTRAVLH